MNYIIYKTSVGEEAGHEKPCKHAYMGTVECIQSRGFRTPEEHDAKWAKSIACGSTKPWLEEGFDHRIEDGHIVRNMKPVYVWYIDIDSMEELNRIIAEEGEVIIGGHSLYDGKTPTIEIYDDCRE